MPARVPSSRGSGCGSAPSARNVRCNCTARFDKCTERSAQLHGPAPPKCTGRSVQLHDPPTDALAEHLPDLVDPGAGVAELRVLGVEAAHRGAELVDCAVGGGDELVDVGGRPSA